MVQGDGGDHGDDGVRDVGRVRHAPEAHLQDDDLHGLVREHREAQRGDRLEVRQRDLARGLELRVHGLHDREDLPPHAHEGLVGHRGAVDADPLRDALQVRRGVAPGPQPVGAQDGLDHPRRGGLAVGAGQVDHRGRVLRVAEQREHAPHRLEPRLHLVLRSAGEQVPVDLLDRARDVPAHHASAFATVTATVFMASSAGSLRGSAAPESTSSRFTVRVSSATRPR